ncbi:pilus assembly protein [Erythrobacter aureus]|uniref:Pilus assembly protein n=2 Tax=Erythrobacter aureus TaxID=2182384 RepID=A0A345YG91_9SPHN|nr:pilus assembly protein [Erythrobacter aureus]
MTGFFRKLIADQQGNTLAIFAAALIPLTIVIGSGLDLSIAYMAKAKLQNACDAAVLAGRQSMNGSTWSDAVEEEANRFFDFNFPDGTLNTSPTAFSVTHNQVNTAEIIGTASTTVPTSLMFIFGYDRIPISASCDATRDFGANDVMLVLDVTGSMNEPPSIGGDRRIVRLRRGAIGLFRALQDDGDRSTTRFGIVPYSQTVNVARQLRNRDILREQLYPSGAYRWRSCRQEYSFWWRRWDTSYCGSVGTYNNYGDIPFVGYRNVRRGVRDFGQVLGLVYRGEALININNSSWGSGGDENGNRQRFRTSGDGCIEERASIGSPSNPIQITTNVTADDIDRAAANGNDAALQFGRYDPGVLPSGIGIGFASCPSEALKLDTYDSEQAFQTAINNTTARVGGWTYHDIGLLWGARFLSRTGIFAADNPNAAGALPINQHMIFMTDGELRTDNSAYSAYGVQRFQNRVRGAGTLNERHAERFRSICNVLRARGVTIWIIAFDVNADEAVENCATSDEHFFNSDGSDLEEVFAEIGRGIGSLRLSR